MMGVGRLSLMMMGVCLIMVDTGRLSLIMMGVRSVMIGADRLSLIVIGAMSLVTGLGDSGFFLHTLFVKNFPKGYVAVNSKIFR
jgi:hypothetical protein